MASSNTLNEYAYYIRGNQVAIVEKDLTKDGDGRWKSPLKDVDAGIMFEYSILPEAPTDEDSTVDIPDYLAKALVYYLKARLSEDRMDIKAKQYFLNEFYRMVSEFKDTRKWGVRRIVSGPYAIK